MRNSIIRQLRALAGPSLALARRIYRPVLRLLISRARSRPLLRRGATRALRRFPAVETYLRRFAAAQGLIEAAPARDDDPYLFRPVTPPADHDGPLTIEHLYILSRSL